MEKENDTFRIVIDFLHVEEPKVTDVIRRILSDYRKSFETLVYRRDLTPSREGKKYFTEFYIRGCDKNRAERLLEKAAG